MEFGKGFGSYYSGWIDFVKEYPQEDRNAYPALFELPKDCYEVKLDKPLGIAFEEGSDGGVVVQYLVEGGNAEQSGVISAGDALLATTACMGRDGTFERKVIPSRFLDFDTIMGEAAARGTAGRVAGAALMPCLWSRCDRLQRAKIQQDEDQRRDPAVCTARRADPPRPARLRPSAITLHRARRADGERGRPVRRRLARRQGIPQVPRVPKGLAVAQALTRTGPHYFLDMLCLRSAAYSRTRQLCRG